MANITITIPDELLTDYIQAYCDMYNFDGTKLANETKAQFARRMVIEQSKDIYRGWKRAQRIQVAQQVKAEDEITIT